LDDEVELLYKSFTAIFMLGRANCILHLKKNIMLLEIKA
jgi:hypothetical protein